MEILQKKSVYSNKFMVFGHRGVPSLCKENTFASFNKAIDLKYDGIELDIMTTKDNHLIVLHDLSININSHQIQIQDLDYNELLEKGNINPPLLKDLLISIGHKIKINIEIKNQGQTSLFVLEKTINLLKSFNLIDNIIISSFNPKIIKQSKKIDDRFFTAWIWGEKNYHPWNCWTIILNYFKPDGIHIKHTLIRAEIVKKLQSKNIKILAYTVNEKKDLLRIIKEKIDGVFTDSPSILKLARSLDV